MAKILAYYQPNLGIGLHGRNVTAIAQMPPLPIGYQRLSVLSIPESIALVESIWAARTDYRKQKRQYSTAELKI